MKNEMSILADYDISNYKAYSRILVHNVKIYSCNWNKNSQSNSTIAYYNKQCHIECGIVKNIVVLKTESGDSNVLLIVTKLQPHNDASLTFWQHIPHVLSFASPSNESQLVAITVDNICSHCAYMSFEAQSLCCCVSKFIRKRLMHANYMLYSIVNYICLRVIRS